MADGFPQKFTITLHVILTRYSDIMSGFQANILIVSQFAPTLIPVIWPRKVLYAAFSNPDADLPRPLKLCNWPLSYWRRPLP